MASTDDHLMILADGLVAALNAASSAFSARFVAAWQDDPFATLDAATASATTVWVIDWSFGRRTSGDGSVSLEESNLLVVIQQKVDNSADTKPQCRAGSLLVAELEAFCRKTRIPVAGDEAVCYQTHRDPARDFGDYANNGRYDAEFTASYRRVGDDD